MIRAALASMVLVLSTIPAAALPKAGAPHPDCLHFGTVYTGSIVEGSFQVYDPGINADIPFEVTAPKFVKVLNKSTLARQFGAGNNFVAGSVEFSIDTSAAGDISGEFTFKLGESSGKLPVSVSVKPTKKGLTRALIVETPFEKYTTTKGDTFKGWTNIVKDGSLDVSYMLVTRGKPVLRDLNLSKYDTVLLASTGLVSLKEEDIKKTRDFAEAGGRVIVAANAFFVGSVEKANTVLDGYGIKMRDKEANFNLKEIALEKEHLDPKLVKAGVKTLHFFRASPVTVTDDKNGHILALAYGVGVPGDGFVAVTNAGKGKMVAIGDSLWWNWVSEKQAEGTENALLLRLLLQPPEGSDY